MVAVVVIAHRPLASALVSAAQHVYSRDPNAAARDLRGLDVAPDAQLPALVAQANELVASADRGQGVLVLTDVLGATPSNLAARLARPGRVAVASGANLPMLLRALCYADHPLDVLLAKAVEGGVRGVLALPDAPSTSPAEPDCPPAT